MGRELRDIKAQDGRQVRRIKHYTAGIPCGVCGQHRVHGAVREKEDQRATEGRHVTCGAALDVAGLFLIPGVR